MPRPTGSPCHHHFALTEAGGFVQRTEDAREERCGSWPGLGIRTTDGGGPGGETTHGRGPRIRTTDGGRAGRRSRGRGFGQLTVAARDDNHIGFLPRGRIDWGPRRLPAGAAQGWLVLSERSPNMRKTFFCGVDLVPRAARPLRSHATPFSVTSWSSPAECSQKIAILLLHALSR
jgi:hypothetical protein